MKILTLEGLSSFLNNLLEKFALKSHTHTVDSALSASSTNPVQNKIVNAAINDVDMEVTTTKMNLDEHMDDSNVHFTEAEKTKLSGIDSGAQVNSVIGVKGDAESTYRTGNINITKANISLGNVDNTSDKNKPVSTAQQTAIDASLNSAKEYTDTKISNMVGSSSVATQIGNHNTSTSAHNDIRVLISDLTTKLNNFLDVDDTTTDQLSEVITLINNNKGTLESLTTSKINVSDIIDNLTTSSNKKVLSAKQGVEIKSLIDALQNELDSHEGNTTVHITSTERTNWNTAKSHADSAHAPSNAEKNQNAFSNIKVSSTTVAADSATDTLEFVGSNVTITPDATNDKITFTVADGSTSAKGIVQLTNSTSSTSTTTAATPSSVKSAYDLANTAKSNAATAQATADGKSDLDHTHKYAGSSTVGGAANSAAKLETSRKLYTHLGTESMDGQYFDGTSDLAVGVAGILPIEHGGTGAYNAGEALKNLGITATATELNYTDGTTSNIQTQLNNKAETSNHEMPHFISLSTIGVNSSSLSATNFISNVKTLCDAMYSKGGSAVCELSIPFTDTSNMSKSIVSKISTDLGVSLSGTYLDVIIKRYNTANAHIYIYPQAGTYAGHEFSCSCGISSSNNTATQFCCSENPKSGVGAIYEHFARTSHAISGISLSGNTTGNATTATFTKSGYYPLGIVGYNFSGDYIAYANLIRLNLSSASNGSATVTYRIRNLSSGSTISATLNVEILWAKVV